MIPIKQRLLKMWRAPTLGARLSQFGERCRLDAGRAASPFGGRAKESRFLASVGMTGRQELRSSD
jgi:hypothetical protein